jgi:hypothetical protein
VAGGRDLGHRRRQRCGHQVHDTLPQPGGPTWSPDGRRLALAGSVPYSTRFREGTNQVLTVSASGPGDDRWFAPVPHLSIDSRGGCGPVWSPDGTKMAAIYEGRLAVWPVTSAGEPLGPPRHLTSELANSPSWAGDSKRLLYQSMDSLKTVDVETGETREVPLDLTYTVGVRPTPRRARRAAPRHEERCDPVGRRRDVEGTGSKRHRALPPRTTAERRRRLHLTVMPAWSSSPHLQPDFGEAQGRAWLAFGVTSVRSPGGIPTRRWRSAARRRRRGAGSTGVHDRPPDGMAACLLQDGHRAAEHGAPRDGLQRARAAMQPAQELRPITGLRAAPGRGVRTQHRDSISTTKLSGGVRRHGWQ